VPVYEGHCLSYAVPRNETSGETVTENLMDLLRSKHSFEFNGRDRRDINELKESLSFVSTDYERDLQTLETLNDLHNLQNEGIC
jgi:actin-related protein